MEPAFSFHHAALKVKWAGEVLSSLQGAVNAWLEEKPFTTRVQYNEERDRSEIFIGIEGISFVIPCLTADVVANLRNALDCAWMGLNRAEGSENKATLPIGSNRKGLITTIGKSAVKARADDAIALLSDDLNAHRDFTDDGSRPLALLNDLNNWQKHNMLLLMPTFTVGQTIRIDTTHALNTVLKGCRVRGYGETVLGSVSGQIINLEQQGETTGEILVGTERIADPQPLIPTMLQLLETTKKAIEAFATRFPEGDSPAFREALVGV
jgi:hypothetical protein